MVLVDGDRAEVLVDGAQDALQALAALRTGGVVHHVHRDEVVERGAVTGPLPSVHLLDGILRTAGRAANPVMRLDPTQVGDLSNRVHRLMVTGQIVAIVVLLVLVLVAVGALMLFRRRNSTQRRINADRYREEAASRTASAERLEVEAAERAERARREQEQAEELAQMARRDREVAESRTAKADKLDPPTARVEDNRATREPNF